MLVRASLLAVVFALVSVACGGSSGGGGSQNTCTSTFDTICQRACSCGGGQCTLVEVTDAGAGASITFNSLSDCEELYVLTCGMAGGVRADFDYAGCTSAVQASACVASAGGGGMGVAYPAICNPNNPIGIDAGID